MTGVACSAVGIALAMSRECDPRNWCVVMRDEHKECQDANPLEGRYANYFEVGHNAFEFILEFGQRYLEGEDAKSHTRIVTSPAYAKAFLETLRNSVSKYEQLFGAIGREVGKTPTND